MTYYVAIMFEEGGWSETMGDHDKECVDFEVQCWKDSRKRGTFKVFRKAFPRVATQRQLNDWASECANKLTTADFPALNH